MEADTKKKLLYGGGALASIVALVLYMRNKQAAQPVYPATTGAGSAGGVSSGTSGNNAAALNAAVALAVEESRQQNALQVAALQSQTALQIAGLQTSSARDIAQAQTAKAALGPGGAATAAAPIAAKGLFDMLQELVKGIFAPNLTAESGIDITKSGLVSAYGTGFDTYGTTPGGYGTTPEGYYVMAPTPTGSEGNFGLPDFTAYTGEPSNYVEPNTYNFFGDSVPAGSASSDYYQGSIGSGDSSYFGDNYAFPSEQEGGYVA